MNNNNNNQTSDDLLQKNENNFIAKNEKRAKDNEEIETNDPEQQQSKNNSNREKEQSKEKKGLFGKVGLQDQFNKGKEMMKEKYTQARQSLSNNFKYNPEANTGEILDKIANKKKTKFIPNKLTEEEEQQIHFLKSLNIKNTVEHINQYLKNSETDEVFDNLMKPFSSRENEINQISQSKVDQKNLQQPKDAVKKIQQEQEYCNCCNKRVKFDDQFMNKAGFKIKPECKICDLKKNVLKLCDQEVYQYDIFSLNTISYEGKVMIFLQKKIEFQVYKQIILTCVEDQKQKFHFEINNKTKKCKLFDNNQVFLKFKEEFYFEEGRILFKSNNFGIIDLFPINKINLFSKFGLNNSQNKKSEKYKKQVQTVFQAGDYSLFISDEGQLQILNKGRDIVWNNVDGKVVQQKKQVKKQKKNDKDNKYMEKEEEKEKEDEKQLLVQQNLELLELNFDENQKNFKIGETTLNLKDFDSEKIKDSAFLTLQSNGVLAIFDENNEKLWQSHEINPQILLKISNIYSDFLDPLILLIDVFLNFGLIGQLASQDHSSHLALIIIFILIQMNAQFIHTVVMRLNTGQKLLSLFLLDFVLDKKIENNQEKRYRRVYRRFIYVIFVDLPAILANIHSIVCMIQDEEDVNRFQYVALIFSSFVVAKSITQYQIAHLHDFSWQALMGKSRYEEGQGRYIGTFVVFLKIFFYVMMFGYCLAVTTKYDEVVPGVLFIVTLFSTYFLYALKKYWQYIRVEGYGKVTKIVRIFYPFYPALLISFGGFYDWSMTNCELNSAGGNSLRLFWSFAPYIRLLYSTVFLFVYVGNYKSYVHTDDDFVFYAFYFFMAGYALIYSLRIIDIFRIRRFSFCSLENWRKIFA